VRRFFEGETRTIPDVYVDRVRKDLGHFWDYLPEGGLEHDETAYLKSTMLDDANPAALEKPVHPAGESEYAVECGPAVDG